MLHMLLICYDPTVAPIPSEQSLQPEHAKLEQELRANRTYVSGAALWPVEAAKTVRNETESPSRSMAPSPKRRRLSAATSSSIAMSARRSPSRRGSR